MLSTMTSGFSLTLDPPPTGSVPPARREPRARAQVKQTEGPFRNEVLLVRGRAMGLIDEARSGAYRSPAVLCADGMAGDTELGQA